MNDIVTQLTSEFMSRLKARTVLVQAEKVRKTYRKGGDEIAAVGDITLEIKKGEILIIMGPSGAGKSTLMNILGGLDRPSGGRVLLDGVDLYSITDTERARIRNKRIGFVFQFYHLLPEFTVLENTMFPALIKRDKAKSKKTIEAEATALLEKVGLANRITHKPDELSGGEAQRVAIARALINDPDVVFCDEPTGNLDSGTSRGICELIHRLNKEKMLTFVIVTHEPSLSEKATKVLHIKDGKLR